MRSKRGGPRPSRRLRRLQIEQLEARYVLNGQAVLAPDTFALRQNGPQIPLLVLANDSFDPDYAGQQLITSVSFGSQGGRLAISADKKSVLYTPPADFAGTETFVYAVDGQHTAQVEVGIQAPLSSDLYQVVPDGNERTLNVLENDPFWSGYTGQKRITSVSVGSAGGSVKIGPDGQSILYTPEDGVAGNERFTYVVDDLYPAQVSINIPNTLKDNNYEFVKYEPPRTLEVTADDLFWPGYSGEKKITHVESSRVGATIQISSDGKSLIYTQPSSYGDQDFSYQLNDIFRYVVDGKYEAYVSIVLHRPVQDDSFTVDENSQEFFFDVTANDTYREAQTYTRDVIDSVTSVTQSTRGGTVAVSADGKGIVYTPASGFTGEDEFTYTADGVHVARVRVNVTRPVRDDEMTARQDTPNTELPVLFNDFKGNGYTGAKLITAAGQTEHGGTVSIRSDGKAIIYTPAPGYTGPDQFTYTVDGSLEATVTLQVAPLAQPDTLRAYPEPGDRPFTIDVLANDYFSQGYAGAGVITSVEVVTGSGQSSIQNQKIVFNPTSAGSHSLRYVVDGKYEGVVSVWIENVAFPDQMVVNENSGPQQINVLSNDFYINYPPYSYSGPRLISGVTQSSHGGTVTISEDGKTVQYQPAADFVGTDTFTYTVDGFMTANVTVNVIRRVRDDEFRVDTADGPQTLPVLVNDPFGADYSGPGQITAISSTTGGGTVTISADGRSIVYTPHEGFVGTDTFVYTVDGTQKAEVSVVVNTPQSELTQTFANLSEYVQFLIDDALSRYNGLFGQDAYSPIWGTTRLYDAVVAYGASDADLRVHSETNVQVAGVDEDDLVEFDSDFIYTLTGGDLAILNAWPAEELSIASRLQIEGKPIGMFLNGDRLTIISAPENYNGVFPYWAAGDSIYTGYGLPNKTIVTVVDVSDRSAPEVVQKTSLDGRYVDSRSVDGMVYVLVENSNAVAPQPIIVDEDNDPSTLNRYETREEYVARLMANQGELIEAALPGYTSAGADGETVRSGLLNSPENIYKPLADGASNLISVVSFDSSSDEPGVTNTSAIYATGASTVYASLDHFYVFDSTNTPEDGAVTRVMKFDWQPETGGINFDATTTVAGSIINQFSVDESNGYLRLATNVRNYNSGNWTNREENTLFVLREDDGVFEFVGGLQNLALNESIRSVRFMGDRAFITTFRDIDPLFAIDLSDPTRPESVGHITIPGFTSYMQLIDENHLLAVGRNTPFGAFGPTQVSLFNISDLQQPLRIAEYTFDRFSTSEAQVDHHAFGYYSDFGLLAMPVSTAHIERVDLDGDGFRETSRTVNDYKLAVFSVDVNASNAVDRLKLKTEIEHSASVRRSGFIGDKLYSIADDSVKVVEINSPENVIATVEIPQAEGPDEISFVNDLDAGIPMFRVNEIEFYDDSPKVNVTEVRHDPMADSIDRVRAQLVEQLGGENGEPLVVTVETSASAAESYYVVCQVGQQNYLYLASADGTVELVDADYHFSDAAGAWHSVHALALQTPVAAVPEAPTETQPVVVPATPETSSQTTPDESLNEKEPGELVQSPTTKPNETEQDTPVDTPATSYFAELGTNQVAANQRHFRPVVRHELSEANSDPSLLVALHGADADNSGDDHWYGWSAETNSDAAASEFVIADLDDAFESLSAF